MRKLMPLMVALIALPHLGAKGGCSLTPECTSAKAQAALLCKDDPGSERCKAAVEFEVLQCAPAPAPTPTPAITCPEGQVKVPDGFGGGFHCDPVPAACPDGFPPGPNGCPKPPILECPKGQKIACRPDPENPALAGVCSCVPDTSDPDIPHSGWVGPIAEMPRLVGVMNATLNEVFSCESGDCVIGPGSGTLGFEEGWKAYDAAQVRVVQSLRAKGYRAGFHDEPNHPDELCVYPLAGTDFCEGYKVITDGNKLKVAFAGNPSKPCYGGRDDKGEPVNLGCPGVGGGSYRGNWQSTVTGPEVPPDTTPLFREMPVKVIEVKQVGTTRKVFDATLKTQGDPDFCKSIGKVDAAGNGRQVCPLGPDCCAAGESCAETEAADPECPAKRKLKTEYETRAGITWHHLRGDGRVEDGGPANDAEPNPFQWVFPQAVAGDIIEACSGNGVCGRVVVR